MCTGGANSYIPTIPTHGYMCPTGHYCVEGTTQEQGCPLGTYQSNMGQDHCLSCPAGKMCTEVNLTLPLDCMTGMFDNCVFKNCMMISFVSLVLIE